MHNTYTADMMQVAPGSRTRQPWAEALDPDPSDECLTGTLVMYLFGDTDPLYRRNFEFFVEHMDADGGDSIEFVIFVQVVRMHLSATS